MMSRTRCMVSVLFALFALGGCKSNEEEVQRRVDETLREREFAAREAEIARREADLAKKTPIPECEANFATAARCPGFTATELTEYRKHYQDLLTAATTPEARASLVEDCRKAAKALTIDSRCKTKTAAPATTTAPTKKLEGEAACQRSIQLARQQQIETAVAMYHACQKGGSSADLAKQTIQSNAKPAAHSASFRHDCARAKSIANAAKSIGADGGSSAVAASCK